MLKNKEAIFKLFISNLHLKYFKLTEYYGRDNGPSLILIIINLCLESVYSKSVNFVWRGEQQRRDENDWNKI